jgi:hypothetical protein
VVTSAATYLATFPLPDAGDSMMLFSTFKAATLPSDAGSDAGPAGALPVASIAPALVTIDAGEQLTLDGSGSTPSAGASLVSFQWQQAYGLGGVPAPVGDGGRTLAFSSSAGGAYVVELVVTDSAGARSLPAWSQVNVRASGGFAVGCGCEAAGPLGIATALLAVALRRRKASAVRSPAG